MAAKILDGKVVSQKVKDRVARDVADLKSHGVTPGLAVIIVGDDKASRTYVDGKKRDCLEVGINSQEYTFPQDIAESELLALIAQLNIDPTIDGILVQLPLPRHISEKAVIEAIDPSKDVDAFHPVNVGRIMIGDYDFLPCTPAGIMELIDDADIPVEGKECVVLGRSNIVGKPMAMLLLHRNGTVKICHTRTKNLAAATLNADILISAVGKASFVTADMVKPGAVVIDVGMNRDENGKRCGDVDYEAVSQKASYITPVPGGVGLMTRSTLLKNTIKAARLHNKVDK